VFGIGGSEILVILIIALLFLGPDKLPDAAKQISKGIRDLKKQSRALQQTIENDEHIGGAIRDLKSALRGEDIPVRPPVRTLPENTIAKPADGEAAGAAPATPAEPDAKPAELAEAKPSVTLPPLAGEIHEEHQVSSEDLVGIIMPRAGEPLARAGGAAEPSIASAGEAGAREPAPAAVAGADVPKQKHG